MARQTGIIQLTGTIGNITFYKSQDGMMAKEKTHISREKILHAPCYERTRENMREFACANEASKHIFNMTRSFSRSASDNRFHSRLVKIMQQVLRMDTYNIRGCRTIAEGIKTDEGKALLRHFNFNKHSNLGRILRRPYVLNPVTGEIVLENVCPVIDFASPRGATHVSLKSAFAGILFTEAKIDIEYSGSVDLPLDTSVHTVRLNIPVLPVLTDESIAFYFLKAEFYQMTNDIKYLMNDGTYNSLELIEVL